MVQREMIIDPITRIEGHLGLRVVVDTDKRRAIPESVRSFVAMFRGFEVFSLGRPPEDLPHITSRICGVCGASHANADVIAADMVYGVSPTPLGVALRNMAFAMTDHIYDHTIILLMLEGPDYSSPVVALMTKSVYDDAKKTLAEHRDIHGFTTIADIMDALTPITGKMWQLAVKFQRLAREAGVLLYGRHSHPSTLVPGGITTDLTNHEYILMGYMFRLVKLTAWAKFMYTVLWDLFDFYVNKHNYAENGTSYHPDPAKSTVGAVGSSGIFDDPEEYASIGGCGAWDKECSVDWEEFYKGLDKAARKRMIKPGVVLRGKLVTDSYAEYQVSIFEHVQHSFYKDWADKVHELPWYKELEKMGFKDPLGNTLNWGKWSKYTSDILGKTVNAPVFHPWLKVTIPNPTEKNWDKKYSWATQVRMVWKDGTITPFEVGPYARLKVTSMQIASDYLGLFKSNGNGVLKVTLPRACTDELPGSVCDEMTFEWKVPDYSSTIYRLWARAFNLLIDVVAAWNNVTKAQEYIASGKKYASRPWKKPNRITFGVGFTEAPRGTVRHWMVQRSGKVLNIQIHAPTTGNVSPFDKYGRSPFEESAVNTVVTEETDPKDWTGLDYVRAIRSFDPCLACAAHITFMKNGRAIKTVKKMITSTHYS